MILSAQRAPNRVHKARASNTAGYVGLLYERKVIKMLKSMLPRFMLLEHNPWFYYQTVYGRFACAPDALIHDDEFGYTIVIEIKNTWTPQALWKLKDLYCPVVARALSRPTKPLVLVKNLLPGAPKPQSTLLSAIVSDQPLLQWLGHGSIQL